MSIIMRDLDKLLIDFCDLESDYFNLMCINKNYYDLIINNELFKQWKKCPSIQNKNVLFGKSCELGLLLFSKYLVAKYDVNINIHDRAVYSGMCGWYRYTNLFEVSCIDAHLDVAKWLFEMSREKDLSQKLDCASIDIHAGNEYLFRHCCMNGDIDVAKWLIDLSRQPNCTLINICVDNNNAFRNSCRNGHYDVAKWLIDLSREPGFTPIRDKMISKYYHPK